MMKACCCYYYKTTSAAAAAACAAATTAAAAATAADLPPALTHYLFMLTPACMLAACMLECLLAVAQVLEANLNGKQYSTSDVQEWTDAICAQTVEALRGISGRFKFTGTYTRICKVVQGSPSGLCWLQIPRVSRAEKGEHSRRSFLVPATSSHRARSKNILYKSS
ncbi:unnamed protein product [Laminaria digitata]